RNVQEILDAPAVLGEDDNHHHRHNHGTVNADEACDGLATMLDWVAHACRVRMVQSHVRYGALALLKGISQTLASSHPKGLPLRLHQKALLLRGVQQAALLRQVAVRLSSSKVAHHVLAAIGTDCARNVNGSCSCSCSLSALHARSAGGRGC